jgi:hypothetical protein
MKLKNLTRPMGILEYAQVFGIVWKLDGRKAKTIPEAYRLTLVAYHRYLALWDDED